MLHAPLPAELMPLVVVGASRGLGSSLASVTTELHLAAPRRGKPATVGVPFRPRHRHTFHSSLFSPRQRRGRKSNEGGGS